MGPISYGSALLLANDLNTLRELMTNSMMGSALDNEAARNGLVALLQAPGFNWKTEGGFCQFTPDTIVLLARSLVALGEEDNDASRAALRAWLPPPAKLLYIAEHETMWLALIAAPVNPALLCARLHGERLGDWKAAVEVAEGVLRLEEFNLVVRIEAHRLLGRAKAELGDRAAACEAAEGAAAEAARAKCGWLEMLSLRDLLQRCETVMAEGVRSRLRGVVAKLAASADELVGVLGAETSAQLSP